MATIRCRWGKVQSGLPLSWLICCGLNSQWPPNAWNLKLMTGPLPCRMTQFLSADCGLKLWPRLLRNFYHSRVTHLTTTRSAPVLKIIFFLPGMQFSLYTYKTKYMFIMSNVKKCVGKLVVQTTPSNNLCPVQSPKLWNQGASWSSWSGGYSSSPTEPY